MHQGASSGTVYIILEHCEATLARELLLSPRGLPLPRAKLLAYQLLQALEHLHVRQVCGGMCRAVRQLAPQLLLDAPAPAFSLAAPLASKGCPTSTAIGVVALAGPYSRP